MNGAFTQLDEPPAHLIPCLGSELEESQRTSPSAGKRGVPFQRLAEETDMVGTWGDPVYPEGRGNCFGERKVLGLYRKRSGAMNFGKARAPNAGAFSIERLEVSRWKPAVMCFESCRGRLREARESRKSDLQMSCRAEPRMSSGSVRAVCGHRSPGGVEFPVAKRVGRVADLFGREPFRWLLEITGQVVEHTQISACGLSV